MQIILKALIISFISFASHAKPLIGLSFNHLKINDGYEYETKYRPNLSIGYNILIGDLFITASTNRLNQGINKKATKNDITYNSYSKINADTISLGLKKKRIIYSVFLSNTEVRKKLHYNNALLGRKIQYSFIYGFNVNYFLNKKVSINTALIAPNQEFDLEGGVNVGINYHF